MMKKIFKYSFLFMLLCIANLAYAQTKATQNLPEMADIMRSNGKIYVVVATLAIILAGVLGYLVWIDKKISNIEKK